MPTPWKQSSLAHKTIIQFCSNTNKPVQKTNPKNAEGTLPSHHNNINGEFLTIAQYSLHMGNFAKYRIVVKTCTQQVVGG
jgi:hypothetical protein